MQVPHARLPLRMQQVRELDLAEASSPGRPAFLSAASGLVRSGGQLYVVADDELHLGCFEERGAAPGTLLRLFDGELPTGHEDRKRRKPDLEMLLRWPASSGQPHGALLALGSGSHPARNRGALVPLDREGRARSPVIPLDATPLFGRLMQEFGDLNLEGAWIDADRLCLLQRGHRGGSPNALIHVDLAAVTDAVSRQHLLPAVSPQAVIGMHLEERDGVPLTFTDACALEQGDWFFSAVAEATDDARADGAFLGAVLGVATREGQLRWLRPVTPSCKVEGVAAEPAGDGHAVFCVTDADDAHRPALLLQARI